MERDSFVRVHALSGTMRRFWSKVDKNGAGGCWVWLRSKDRNGYGRFSARAIRRSPMLAHRVAWFLWYGKLPVKGLMHLCDNPSCVNPAHLREGTQKENMWDASVKGRCRSASRPLLSRRVVRAAVARKDKYHVTYEQLAAELGVCGRTLWRTRRLYGL